MLCKSNKIAKAPKPISQLISPDIPYQMKKIDKRRRHKKRDRHTERDYQSFVPVLAERAPENSLDVAKVSVAEMRGADDNVVTLHGAAAASPPQPPLPRTRSHSRSPGREGGLGIAAGRAAGSALAAGTRVPYARLRCAPRRLRMPAKLAQAPAQCSPGDRSGDVEPRGRMRPRRGPGRAGPGGSGQSPRCRAQPGIGSRPRGRSSGHSIPRAGRPHLQSLPLAGMSVIIVRGVAGPSH